MRSNSDGGILNERRSMSATQQVPMEKHGSSVLVASQGGRLIFAESRTWNAKNVRDAGLGETPKKDTGPRSQPVLLVLLYARVQPWVFRAPARVKQYSRAVDQWSRTGDRSGVERESARDKKNPNAPRKRA
jgi:hypothetical protein